ncbi:MAG: hypothetical protein PHI27_07690 [Eubacteriales bacterium]|nr:hypothetical protein [Eubacteriales bacterium]MDD3882118.1 hypothetical protein [Eubacteriales bacterium]MDD4513223.1 hypothetical protein [Eubacteriales bacterium]
MIFWTLFIGIGALAGGIAMLIKPDGSILQMQPLLPYFQVLPFADALFQDYFFSGIALLLVNCVPNLIAAYLLIKKKPAGIKLSAILGVTLALWIIIQFIIFPLNFMDIAYFLFGLIQALTGYACWVFYRQSICEPKLSDYKNIGSNKSELVVYFSRLGRARKAAYEAADKSGAEVFEIKSKERTEGTLGFWWCGRFGMHNWAMEIEALPEALESYKKVTIVSPVWVFHICGPIRRFCELAKGRIKNADYILVHFQPAKYNSAKKELDSLLGITGGAFTSICSELGHNRVM